MPKTNAQKGDEVRTRLRAAATELIPELGWGAVSTRLIAQRAGLAPGLVHYHFDSVPALLREVASRAVSEASNAMLEQVETLSIDDGLDAMLSMLDSMPGDDPLSLTLTEAYLAATRDEQLRGVLVHELDEFQARLSVWLANGGEQHADALAVVLAGLIDGIMLQRALGSRRPTPDLAPVLRRLFEKGHSS